jgi:hypothetical protein
LRGSCADDDAVEAMLGSWDSVEVRAVVNDACRSGEHNPRISPPYGACEGRMLSDPGWGVQRFVDDQRDAG